MSGRQSKVGPLEKGLVKGVISGDTIVIVKLVPMDKMSARGPQEYELTLHGIRAPLLKSKDGQEQPWAWKSREFLRNKLIGRGIAFRVTNTGVGNRRYADVYLTTGEDVREDIIANGWAEVYPSSSERRGDESKAKARLIELEQKAKDAKKGIWKKDTSDSVRKIEKDTDAVELFDSKFKNKVIKAVVEQVRSGSSFIVYVPETRNMVKLILSGAQSPNYEFNLSDEKQQPFAREAKFFSELEVLHRDVDVIFEGVDKSNTFYGSIIYNGSTNLADKVLRNGLAVFVEWSGSKTSDPQLLRDAEASAKKENLRIWGSPSKYTSSSSVKKLPKSNEFYGRVVEVINAATIVVVEFKDGQKGNVLGKERKVFFSSIATPKNVTRDSFKSVPNEQKIAAYYALEGKEALRKKIIGKKVKCVLDYIRPSIVKDSDVIPETPFYSVYLDKQNVAIDLLKQGYITVIDHRALENRSPDFNDLLSAERSAAKKGVGLHSSKSSIPTLHFTNYTKREDSDEKGGKRKENYEQYVQAQSARLQQYLPLLQRAGRVPAVVERVFSGSRFHVWIEKETCVIPLTLYAVKCERVSEHDELSIGNRAYEWAYDELYQRDVEVQIESVDPKSGNFSGIIYLNGKDISPRILEKGFGKVFDRAAKTCKSINYDEYKRAENSAKQSKLGVWENYDEEAERLRKQQEREKREAERNEKKKDEILNVRVTEIVSSTSFYFTILKEGENQEEKVANEIKQLNLSDDSVNTSSLKEGDHVLSKFQGEWYRAKVSKVLDENTLSVFYIDYGNYDKVEKSTVRPLPSSISVSTIPPLANHGSLAYVKKSFIDDEYGEDAAYFFRKYTWGKDLTANVEYVDGDTHYVILTDPSQEVSVNEALVEEGLLKVQHKLRFGNKQFVKKLREFEKRAISDRKNIWRYGDISSDDE